MKPNSKKRYHWSYSSMRRKGFGTNFQTYRHVISVCGLRDNLPTYAAYETLLNRYKQDRIGAAYRQLVKYRYHLNNKSELRALFLESMQTLYVRRNLP